jgi:hypothetical protein
MQQRRRLGQSQPIGHRDQRVGRDLDLLGITAVTDSGHDALPDPARIHSLSDRDHLSRDTVAWHVRRIHREVLATPSLADLGLEEQDVHDRDADHDLSRPSDRIRYVAHGQHLGPTELSHLYHTHAHRSP